MGPDSASRNAGARGSLQDHRGRKASQARRNAPSRHPRSSPWTPRSPHSDRWRRRCAQSTRIAAQRLASLLHHPRRQQTFCTHPWTYATLSEPRLRLVVDDAPARARVVPRNNLSTIAPCLACSPHPPPPACGARRLYLPALAQVYIHPVPEDADDESLGGTEDPPSSPPRPEPLLEIRRPRPRQWSPVTHMAHFAPVYGDAVRTVLHCHNRLRKARFASTSFLIKSCAAVQYPSCDLPVRVPAS